MTYATVCSGIGAPEQAWSGLWGHPEFTSEIEAFPSAVLRHHYPDVPNHGDMTKYKEWPDHEQLGLICGGTPCQSFSVAGLRQGLDDPRGNLTLIFLGLIARYNPRWVVWENVPGVFSSGQGADLRAFLAGLAELGYSSAYRVLDAQFFGVPQRRRRLFVIGYIGDWRPPFAVLSEPQSLRGHTPKGRKAGQEVAGDAPIGIDEECNATIDKYGPLLRGGQGGTRQACMIPQPIAFGGNNTQGPIDKATACNAKGGSGRMDFESETFLVQPEISHALTAEGFDASEDGSGRGTPIVTVHARQDPITVEGKALPLDVKGNTQAVCFAENSRSEVRLEGGEGDRTGALNTGGGKPGQGLPCVAFQVSHGQAREKEVAPPLMAHSGPNRHGEGSFSTTDFTALVTDTIVRRLTPRECERLQGFPDDYTLIPWKNGMATDGHRYKALGNSMAVPVVRWIGERIQMWEELSI